MMFGTKKEGGYVGSRYFLLVTNVLFTFTFASCGVYKQATLLNRTDDMLLRFFISRAATRLGGAYWAPL